MTSTNVQLDKRILLTDIYGKVLTILSSSALPRLQDAPLIPNEGTYPGARPIGFVRRLEGQKSLLYNERKGLLGPLYPCWDLKFCLHYEGGDSPIWGILPDGRWIHGTISLKGDQSRDDSWICTYTSLKTSWSIPQDVNVKLLVRSMLWTIEQHPASFQTEKVYTFLCFLETL